MANDIDLSLTKSSPLLKSFNIDLFHLVVLDRFPSGNKSNRNQLAFKLFDMAVCRKAAALLCF